MVGLRGGLVRCRAAENSASLREGSMIAEPQTAVNDTRSSGCRALFCFGLNVFTSGLRWDIGDERAFKMQKET